jgi:hypothetical protein
MKDYKNQRAYYWRHREKILALHAERAKDPEYKKHKAEISLKSYYKRKEEKNERRNSEEVESLR